MTTAAVVQLELGLTNAQLDAIAERVAAILRPELEALVASEQASPYVTVEEAAELLRTTRSRLDNLLSRGELTRVKDGRRTLIERAEIERRLAGERTGPVALLLPTKQGGRSGSGVAR